MSHPVNRFLAILLFVAGVVTVVVMVNNTNKEHETNRQEIERLYDESEDALDEYSRLKMEEYSR